MAIIAAEALGIPLNQIQLTNGDTDVTPYSVGESGSRTTPFTGPAVIAAAEDVRRQIFDLAARQLKVKPKNWTCATVRFFVKSRSGAEDSSGNKSCKMPANSSAARRPIRTFKEVEGKELLGPLRRGGSGYLDGACEDHPLRRGA